MGEIKEERIENGAGEVKVKVRGVHLFFDDLRRRQRVK
jgi:hypothetical protein